MRVISGTAKGRKLYAPRTHNIRPALDKVKGAIFNILFNVEGLRVLDLFAGTGAVGIEALSRGATHCTFVDAADEAVTIIRKNIALCSFEDRAKLFPKRVDVSIDYFAKHEQKFDLIFVDPPYLKDLVNPTLEKIANAGILAPTGRIIVEHHPKEPIQSPISPIFLVDQRKYGQTLISFLAFKT
ncbi:MAG: 16S rRNA (guanine(966)-N(2))-methyltransferase RsmD [Deltaproteobacteria bacterium]|nr:16S rRNA (guanine(966)-N(2))-methyltransferase RsmD [Deltaproteobacteria bacterium]